MKAEMNKVTFNLILRGTFRLRVFVQALIERERS